MDEYRHFLLSNTASTEGYTSTSRGSGTFRTPPRDCAIHGRQLADQFRKVQNQATVDHGREPATENLDIVPVTFASNADHDLKLESLENKPKGIRILNVREESGRQVATVAIPKGKTDHFAKRFDEYATETTEKGNPKHNDLAASIAEVKLAFLRDYWTDSGDDYPVPTDEFWWEVWLERSQDEVEATFRAEADRLGMQVSPSTVRFPEVIVILAYTSLDHWSQFAGLLNYLAEFRRAKIVPGEFLQLPPKDQAEFVHALRARTTAAGSSAPAVCVLDTGVNRGHPLLEDSLAEDDSHVWNPEWPPGDQKGHGTELAGLALYGPLEEQLLATEPVQLRHRLEAAKILPHVGENSPPDYGPITVGSMAMAELQAPERSRVFCLAVTADDRDTWRPTLWSAELDQACSGALDEQQRLLFVSAGNLAADFVANYPDANHIASVQDPAQCWNAVTVGAFTDKVWIQDPTLKGWTPIAPKGQLSPASTTSLAWDSPEWPIKPDIVLEGGNWAKDPAGFVSKTDDLSLLTTAMNPPEALLALSEDTSAATALASRMGATLLAEYPEFWPETLRGLLVHSAEWTPEMLEEFPHSRRHERMRCYGWGIPNLQRARECAKNVATMIIQDSMQPFQKEGSRVSTKEMKLHALPFPKTVLQDLGEEEVTMRVTLSYFIAPSPGRKGWNIKHRYASHGLRFDVKRPEESMQQLRERLTRNAWDDPQVAPRTTVSDSRNWSLGKTLRTKGSLHSDTWQGTASQLADSEYVAVFPVTGWWRERPGQECYDKNARYALIISIESASRDLELYQAVYEQISVAAATSVTEIRV